ncbi:MAG: hypothetical protein LBH76_04650, partial [Propionibacteriaceae bacterium]|nr:hypothetical protein [Propionibacteriaceae bacterium]
GCAPALPPQQFTPPTWTPSPSPTPPEGAPIGWQPDWTEDQIAVARIVDAYIDLTTRVAHDPAGVSLDEWSTVTDEPEWSRLIQWHESMIGLGYYGTGGVQIDRRRVESETVSDKGRRQFVVVECDDVSGQAVFDSDGQPLESQAETPSPERFVSRYTVQWVDVANNWLVIMRNQVGTC